MVSGLREYFEKKEYLLVLPAAIAGRAPPASTIAARVAVVLAVADRAPIVGRRCVLSPWPLPAVLPWCWPLPAVLARHGMLMAAPSAGPHQQ